MRKLYFGAIAAVSALALTSAFSTAQMQSNNRLIAGETATVSPSTPQNAIRAAGKIEQIQIGENGAGWARSNRILWRTHDNGKSWQEIALPKSDAQTISGFEFVDEQNGFVVFGSRESNAFEIARTANGGATWTKQRLNLPAAVLSEADFDRVWLRFADAQRGRLVIRLSSSSNFVRAAVFETREGGAKWRKQSDFMQPGEHNLESVAARFTEKQTSTARVNNREIEFSGAANREINVSAPLAADENATAIDFSNAANGWLLVEAGRCAGFKSNCEQTARILATSDNGASWFDATPFSQEGAKGRRAEGEILNRANSNSPFRPFAPSPLLAAPPLGATRISTNRGFDKCTAAPVSQMQTWWNTSPFTDANIYIAGRNRGCTQAQLTAAWVDQVSAMGWGLIPTIVGYQAPCSSSTNSQKHSSDPAIAETQGREEADISIAAAVNLGFAPGTILYYDMERYDETAATPNCRNSVKGFLKGWTERVKELGYISGVYGAPVNAVNDWTQIPAQSRMDAIWMARWDNVASVWQYNSPAPQIPNGFWMNHQRIKQWQAPHNETWGGVTFNIDGNLADAPVAGFRAAKNKQADFNGDGKSDIAVFRPENGVWYVRSETGSDFYGVAFGLANDRLTPGDFDGDGRTDFAVFRPETGVWYALSLNYGRSTAAATRIRQFGVSGDVPVAADYDGDNITDPAVFRAGAWHIADSLDGRSPNYRVEQFGVVTDLPVVGDYDGDGKADLAVFRPNEGVWYIRQNDGNFVALQWGVAGDRPVQGDYDGDGKTDIAVWRPSSAVWYVLTSSGAVSVTTIGAPGDNPAPGDYDADGKTDAAVFRPSNGTWFLQQSQNGAAELQFGLENDRPIAAGYVAQ